jgi:hypothetical protein
MLRLKSPLVVFAAATIALLSPAPSQAGFSITLTQGGVSQSFDLTTMDSSGSGSAVV